MHVATDLIERVRAARARIESLTIFRIPAELSTLIAVTPEAIESFPGVSRDETVDGATIAAALDAVVASAPQPADGALDTRFALIFCDADGARVLRVYKGSFASQGRIDDVPCAFDEPVLHAWLTARYS